MPPKLFRIITFIGSVTRNIHVRFLSGEALRALFPEVLLICIHMNLSEFVSFTYEKRQSRQNRQVFGGPAAEGGGPYEDLILLFPFTFLKTARQAFFGEGAAGFMGFALCRRPP